MNMLQPRRLQPLKMILPLLVIVFFFLYTYVIREPPKRPAPVLEVSGEAQGTTWRIQIAAPVSDDRIPELSRAIENAFQLVDDQMSNYETGTVISTINDAPAGRPVELPADFRRVLDFSLDLSRRSGGAFDPTLQPLLTAWGFGPKGRPGAAPEPTDAEIADARRRIGASHLSFDAEGRLVKDRDDVELDLGAVAQGFTVDLLSGALSTLGYSNFFVEVGGEVFARGHNERNIPWRIGIDSPRLNSLPGESLEGILNLSGLAVSTSGDNRSFRTNATGGIVSHLLDPRTGRSVERPPSSVTVVAEDCLTADGLATTLYVMGPETGYPWLATNYPGAEAIFFVMQPDGRFGARPTPGFEARTGYRPRGR